MAAAVVMALILAGCENFPEGFFRCINDHVEIRTFDTDGDGIDDAIGPVIERRFVVGCSVPGEDFELAISTEVVNGTRVYRGELISGPGAESTFKAVDVYDAISGMDQVLKANGFDLNYQPTSEYRDAIKAWLISNWMSPEQFHSATGY
ncbi:MAG: hypothetical protein KF869_11630 [Phycisphaeraceae bacterium]|nr:hypothetical protein [Phycisphaeraceae bacterium]